MFVAMLTQPNVPNTIQVVTWDGSSREMSWMATDPSTGSSLALKVPLSASESDFQAAVTERALAGGWYPTFAG